MKKRVLALSISVVMLLMSVCVTSAVCSWCDDTSSSGALPADLEPLQAMDQELKYLNVKSIHPNTLVTNGDTRVTYSDYDECHPDIGITSDGNPCLIYELQIGAMESDLYIQRSPDGGETWPEDLVWGLGLGDMIPQNPEISFLENRIYAFGTYNTAWQDPVKPILTFPDINDPGSWSLTGYLDASGTSTYVKETAITAMGTSTVAIGAILDYHTSDYDLTDTLVINWNCYLGEGDWPGVVWLNNDNEGNPMPDYNLVAGVGEKCYFIFQRDVQGKARLYASYATIDEETTYQDWKLGAVAGGQGNCSNPDISVSGKNAYVVYMDDKAGNQDIYCATTTSGGFWRKYVVANSPDDETYPVISADGDSATCLFLKNGNLYKTQTEDFGATWSEPVQVNDEDGTVVDEYKTASVAGFYGVWTDNRNGNDDIYFESVGLSPILTVEDVSGGFGVKAALSNVGNAPAENAQWTIDLDGTVFVGAHKEGTITLEPGETQTVSTGLILGIGSVTILVAVDGAEKQATAFVLGPLVLQVT
jgi:hypothetical protein